MLKAGKVKGKRVSQLGAARHLCIVFFRSPVGQVNLNMAGPLRMAELLALLLVDNLGLRRPAEGRLNALNQQKKTRKILGRTQILYSGYICPLPLFQRETRPRQHRPSTRMAQRNQNRLHAHLLCIPQQMFPGDLIFTMELSLIIYED